MSLATPASVQKLQAALHDKAKRSRLSFLCDVRQGVPQGRSEFCLRVLPSQRRSSRSG